MSRRFIEKFNVLMVIDLDEGNPNVCAVLFGEGVLLIEAEEVMSERDGLGKIRNEVSNM
jgi:hypothetical protein